LHRHTLECIACAFVSLFIAGCGNATSGPTTACSANAPPPGLQTLASHQNPTSVAIDGSSVYWSVLPPGPRAAQGAILRAPLGGGTITTLASFTPYNFGSIVVDDTSVYWSNTPDSSMTDVQITKADKNGGGPPVVIATSPGPTGMVLDATSIYWCALGSGGGTVATVGKTGGAPVTLATEQAQIMSLAVDSTYVYYGRGGSSTLNGVPQGPDGAIVSVPLAGGMPRTLVSMHGTTPLSVAVQGSYVYYTTMPYPPGPSRAGTLMRVPVGYGTPTTLASESDVIDALVVDSAHVYWGGVDIGLKSMPLAGGTPTEPAPCQAPVGIAVSGSSLFWVNSQGANRADGSVMRLTPK
jgi:hypothetical protein